MVQTALFPTVGLFQMVAFCALTDWSVRCDSEIPHHCCALCFAIYFGSMWTAANKRLRSHTAKASGRHFINMRRPSSELAGRKINERRCSLTQSSCLTCETQNWFPSTSNCLKTIKTNKAFWYRTKCLSFSPIQEKTSVLLFRERAKQN